MSIDYYFASAYVPYRENVAGAETEHALHIHFELLEHTERHKRLYRSREAAAVNAARALAVKRVFGGVQRYRQALMTYVVG